MRKRACDACHKRKIQCDGEAPDKQCNWCYHHRVKCTWDRVLRPRGRATEERSRSGTRSVRHSDESTSRPDPTISRITSVAKDSISPVPADKPLERQELPEAPLNHEPVSPPQTISRPGVFFGKLHFAGHDLGHISSYNGIPIFSDDGKNLIRSRTGQDAVFPSLLLNGPRGHDPRRLHQSVFATLGAMQHLSADFSLPERRVVDEYLRFFRTSFFKLEFPVVDAALFHETVDIAYQSWEGSGPPEAIAAKACVFAFLSVIPLFENDRQPASPPVDGDTFAAKTQYLLPLVLQDLNLTVLQTVLMLSLHQLLSGQVPSASLMHSLACRIMFVLGGHSLTDPWSSHGVADPTTREKRHLRRLFWLCFILDKEIALRTGQPPSIDDDHCDLTLPEGYLQVQYLDRSFYSDARLLDDGAVPIHPGDLRLSIIKSRACKILYSAEALGKSDAELLRDIRELDDELERWRLSVPPRHRPVLSMPRSGTQIDSIECPESVRSIVIHFEYHHLVATIHRATGRCQSWKQGSGVMEGVSSSLAISVEASRSTLLYLRFAIHALHGEAFWMIVFYPMTAASSLFLSILIDPCNPRAHDDLELLDSVPELIKSIRLRRLTQSEMLHLKMVDDFLAELIRLGRSAIEYASSVENHHQIQGNLRFSLH